MRLGLTNDDKDDLELGLSSDNGDDLELGLTIRDEDDLELDGTSGYCWIQRSLWLDLRWARAPSLQWALSVPLQIWLMAGWAVGPK